MYIMNDREEFLGGIGDESSSCDYASPVDDLRHFIFEERVKSVYAPCNVTISNSFMVDLENNGLFEQYKTDLKKHGVDFIEVIREGDKRLIIEL